MGNFIMKTLFPSSGYLRKCSGFTLIELLITIAIIGIIAMVAFPSYLDSMQQSRRYTAQQSMVELSQQLERYYSRNGKYSGASATASDYSDTNYTLSFSTLTDTQFTISAAPVAGSSQADDNCATLTLNHLGSKTPTTSGCWK